MLLSPYFAMIGRNAMKRAEADMIAQSAIARGVLGIIDPRPERRWRVDGMPRAVDFRGTRITIAIQDAFGLIDLNEADAALLAQLFKSAGLDDRLAERLAARTVAWRSSGVRSEIEGARGVDYGEAGLPYEPRRAPFQSVEELRLVLGMTAEIFARVEPALTVHSHQPSIDQRVAPREALMALPGIDRRQVDAILSEREGNADMMGADSLPFGESATDPGLAQAGHTYSISANFTYRGTPFATKAVIRIGNDPAQPYVLFATD